MLSGYNENMITSLNQHATLPIKNTNITCFPNPFSTSTTIGINIPVDISGTTPVTLAVYNFAGNKVTDLFSGNLTGGTRHKFIWNGKDLHNREVAGGVYYMRAKLAGVTVNSKLVLIR